MPSSITKMFGKSKKSREKPDALIEDKVSPSGGVPMNGSENNSNNSPVLAEHGDTSGGAPSATKVPSSVRPNLSTANFR